VQGTRPKENIMNVILTSAAFLTIASTAPAIAQHSSHRLGEHPVVIAKRVYEQQGYDYAAKFYPHPAWLYLQAGAPASTNDQRVDVARSEHAPVDAVSGATTSAATAAASQRP
jgi:hypothetical protein